MTVVIALEIKPLIYRQIETLVRLDSTMMNIWAKISSDFSDVHIHIRIAFAAGFQITFRYLMLSS